MSKADWERWSGRRANKPGMWIRFNKGATVVLSHDLVKALRLKEGYRGIQVSRWYHDGEVMVRILPCEDGERDFRVTLKREGGYFQSQRLAMWLGLGESRSKQHTYLVTYLKGEGFIFSVTPVGRGADYVKK